ncbi:STAS domain-containing protein [Planctomycetes bacterium K23_9]|uniref:STAS domain-containing protein n=1 Tax=Stieleria marina TaxID=1930275 RepID=A0A517NUX8_9BACT|nr:hypothetical protein K239x_29050 [Planctomycetes bacterium K23_9]
MYQSSWSLQEVADVDRTKRVAGSEVLGLDASGLATEISDLIDSSSETASTNTVDDSATGPQLDSVPDTANGHGQLEIDFADIQTLSSAHLGGLIRANREARGMNVALVLVNVCDPVKEIFSLTRLDRMFTFVEKRANVNAMA